MKESYTFLFYFRFRYDASSANFLKLLRSIKVEHGTLSSICKTLNIIFSVQLLITVTKIFFSLLSTLFFWAQNILMGNWSSYIVRPEMYYPYSGSLLLLHVIHLLALVYCCSQTAKEVS